MADIERAKRHLAEDRRIALVHAKARMREIEEFVVVARARLDEGRLDGLEIARLESATRMLARTVDQDALMAFFQREIGG